KPATIPAKWAPAGRLTRAVLKAPGSTQRPMRITQRPRDLPHAILLPPNYRELARSFASRRRVAEAVRAERHGAVTRNREHAKARDIEFATELATHILAHAVDHRVYAEGEAGIVMVELDMLVEKPGVFLEFGRIDALVE